MKKQLWKIDRWQLVGLLLIVLASLLGILVPLQLKKVIDLTDGSALLPALSLFLLFLGNAVFLAIGNFLFAKSGEEQVAQLRKDLIAHLHLQPLSFFHQQKSGELASRVVNDSLSIRDFLIRSIPSFVSSFVILIGSVFVLLVLDWRLSLCLFIGLPAMLVFVIPLSKIGQKSAKAMQEETSRLTGALSESFQEIAMIKAQTAEHQTIASRGQLVKNLKSYALINDRLQAFESPLALLFIFGIMSLIFLYGGRRVAEGSLSIGTLISFMVYLLQLLNPVGSISAIMTDYAKQKGATATLLTLLEAPVEDRQGSPVPAFDRVSFSHLGFSYGDRKILSDISLDLRRGQKVALVGPSGSGKTTLVNLLLRFYQPQEGQILAGQADISQFDLTAWRRQIALVSQAQSILSGTVKDNLLFGLNHEVTEEAMMDALKKAYFDEDIKRFTDGLDSPVGERGKLLSGGQKQRLQIARAYLQDSPILIFDEATANLDADAEYQINQSLNALIKDKLALVIAHRLSTVVDADVIYFLENSRVTGVGSHQTLLASHATYARFVSEQLI